MSEKKRIAVIDGQGGLTGKQLSDRILEQMPDADLIVIGTNSIATANMLKGLARRGATGENPVLVAARTADIICGPIGIIAADAMLGEITPAMAAAVGQSRAEKILIPMNRCGIQVAGAEELPLADRIEDAVRRVLQLMQ